MRILSHRQVNMRSTSIQSPNSQANDAGLGTKAGGSVAPNHLRDRTVLHAVGRAPRVEPWLEGAVPPKPTYEELRQLVALYDRPVPKRRPMVRTVAIAFIFIVGAAVGVGGASLLTARQNDATHIPSGSLRTLAIQPNGISEGELPYDGRAAGTVKEQARDVLRGINVEELPYGGGVSAGAVEVKMERVEPVPLSPPIDANTKESEPGAAVVKADASPPAAGQAEKQARRNIAPASKKPLPTQARGNRSQHRADKDKEIQRIRQQAEEELKKKPDSGRRAAESRGVSRAATQKERHSGGSARHAHAATMTAMLQQCEQAGNIISREYCKWQLCSGKWGKSGCPSYPPSGNLY